MTDEEEDLSLYIFESDQVFAVPNYNKGGCDWTCDGTSRSTARATLDDYIRDFIEYFASKSLLASNGSGVNNVLDTANSDSAMP